MLKLFFLVCFAVNVLVESIPLDEPIIEEHIVGENKTEISEVPHRIAMYYNDALVCGGFILTPKHVVTTAQCLHSLELDENYDIPVLELETTLKLNDKTMKAIKLAAKEPCPGTPALVSGFGALDERNRPECYNQQRFRCTTDLSARLFISLNNITITPRMSCAGGNKKFTDLRNDGGAPVYNNKVVGTVSFRFVSGDRRRLIVFTNMVHPKISKFVKEAAKL